MYMWRELDLGEVRAEFAHMRDLGFRVVRIFLLTEDFLPAPMTVPKDKVAALVDVARTARDEKLLIIPTLVTINMSGKFWWPAWMRDASGIREACTPTRRCFVRRRCSSETCARALAGDASIRAFDLEQRDRRRATPAEPRRRLALGGAAGRRGAARGARRARPVRGAPAVAHGRTRTCASTISPSVVDEDCMHAYPLYCDVAKRLPRSRARPLLVRADRRAGRHRPRAADARVRHLHGAAGGPGVTITDDFLGQPRAQYLASEEEGARYYGQVLERLAATGAAGAYAWCYGDYDPKLFDRAPFDTAIRERSFGLVRADGSEKPACAVVRAFASRLALGEVPFGSAPEILDLDADAYYAAPEDNFRRLYERWLTAPR